MPTILTILGWRLFFYSNENNEPMHIHAQKAETECKFWIKVDDFEIEEAYSFNLNQQQRREIRKIIFEHFDYIIQEWHKHFNK
ncbi:MAG: DUF4160 domain-containing protein [Bacteroidota bacterium]